MEFSILSMMITQLLLFARFSILLRLKMDTRSRLLRCRRCFKKVKDCIHKHFYIPMNIVRCQYLYPVHLTFATGIRNITEIIGTRWIAGICEFTNTFCMLSYSLNAFYWLKKFVTRQQRLYWRAEPRGVEIARYTNAPGSVKWLYVYISMPSMWVLLHLYIWSSCVRASWSDGRNWIDSRVIQISTQQYRFPLFYYLSSFTYKERTAQIRAWKSHRVLVYALHSAQCAGQGPY